MAQQISDASVEKLVENFDKMTGLYMQLREEHIRLSGVHAREVKRRKAAESNLIRIRTQLRETKKEQST
jgi:hypothetical protein